MSLQSIIQENSMPMEDGTVLESASLEALSQIITVALESTCTEEELEELEESYQQEGISVITESTEYAAVLEKSIVKLDKKAKKQQQYKMAILHVAKDMGMKEYKQWCTLKKMDIILMRIMEKRCAMKAKAYMKQAAKEAKKSAKKQFKKAGDSLTKSERNTQKAMNGNHVIPSALKNRANAIASKFKTRTM